MPTILVTGSTDGLGRAVATSLAESGARVVLHGRDDARGKEAMAEIRAATGNQDIHWQRADFASLDSVAALAEGVQRDYDRLDVLVNNAGLGTSGPREESEDGHELRFAVNYLAHFALTRALLPLLGASAPARIVNVSSAGQAPIDFDDVMLENRYDGVQAYCQSKLAQVMFTIDLAEELDPGAVAANCLHPASYMPTKMVRKAGVSPMSSLEQGRDATVRLVNDAQLAGVSGRYFNGLDESRAHPQAYDREARRRLRELSERLVKIY